jgi:hypothetical protein
MGVETTFLADAADALKDLKAAAPDIAKAVPALAPFLPAIGIFLHGIHTLEQSSDGHSTAAATATVAAAAANQAPAALSGDHIDAAAAAVDSGDPAEAVTALQALPAPNSCSGS